MPIDPLDLSARRAVQRDPMSLNAFPAAQTAHPPPITPHPFVPDSFLDLPKRRTLGRARMPLRAVSLSLLGFVLLVLVVVVIRLSGLEERVEPNWRLAIDMTAAYAMLAVLWVWLPRWIMRRHDAADLIQWRRPRRGDVLWALCGLVSMVVVWLVFEQIADWGDWWWTFRGEPPEDWSAFPNWWVAGMLAASAVILAPLVEETFFRGFILGGLNRVWWMVPSLVLSAALFSAVHLNLYAAIPFGIFGLIFGALYLRTKHLTAPALAHAGWNLGVILLLVAEHGVG
ncbi:MAG: type II CAAX endopeptidase family protein [Chloroflexi bacterium]|nr:type II CAAX endopeptidase family protein [Chloroflexota bacterium]